MRLTTWNVNGIRNPFSYPPWNSARTFLAMFDILASDIVVMQELKIQRKDLRDDMVLIDGWDCYFSLPKHKKGYSGVGIYTRNATCAPIRAEEGLLGVLPSPSGVPYCELPEDQGIGGYPTLLQVTELGVDPAVLDAEGRCLVLEFPAFVLFGVYSPANSNGMRDDFRYGFITALDCRIRNLIRNGKRVVLVGDLNVSRDELDTASAVEDCRKAGITHSEYISTPNRRIFNQLLIGGEVAGERDEGREEGVLWDTTRAFHSERKGMYTHWEQKINARPGNYGSRIDFVLVSEGMQTWIRDANIQEGLLGSDHCPVFVDFHDGITIDDNEVITLDVMNPLGTFNDGLRKLDWKVHDVPEFSAKRMPEFDKRRSIKSMFAAPTVKKSQSFLVQPADKEPLVKDAGVNGNTPIEESEHSQTITKSEMKPTRSEPAEPSPAKRKVVSTQTKPLKKQKTESASQAGKGQQSLKGFFQTHNKSPATTSGTNGANQSDRSGDNDREPPEEKTIETTDSFTVDAANTQTSINTTEGFENAASHASPSPSKQSPSPSQEPSPSPSQFSAQLAAAEQNQRSWGALFSKPIAPLCEGHDEPCKTMLTKKKGSNQGRSFWMCARPLGPSGNKERGTQWRCPTFIWCSDWDARKDKNQTGG